MGLVKSSKMRNHWYRVLLFGVFICSLFACQKQKDVSINKLEENGAGFLPLAVGNYWIYDVSIIDSINPPVFVSWDSTYIERDTLIGENLYYVFKSSSAFSFQQLLRDSSSFIVDEKGEVFLAPTNFTDTLSSTAVLNINGDTISFTFRKMFKPNGPTSCFAGFYNALDARVTRILPFVQRRSYAHYYYAPYVGLILRQDFPLLSGKSTYYNLHHYHVQ
jgi:hypothetical protein